MEYRTFQGTQFASYSAVEFHKLGMEKEYEPISEPMPVADDTDMPLWKRYFPGAVLVTSQRRNNATVWAPRPREPRKNQYKCGNRTSASSRIQCRELEGIDGAPGDTRNIETDVRIACDRKLSEWVAAGVIKPIDNDFLFRK